MEKIAAATTGSKGQFAIEIRAVNPDGFEEHKQTLSDLAKIDLVDRFENVGDWPIYALLVPTEGDKTCDSDDPGGPTPDSLSEEEEVEIKHKKKKKKKQQVLE